MTDLIREPCDEGVVLGARAAAPSEASKNWILAATILGSSMVFINGSTVNVALPALQEALNATVVDMQWVVNSYTLFLAALILLGGSLGDHYGRKRIFLVGVVIFTLASIASGLAPNVSLLIAARAAQGVGGALLTPGSLAIISAAFSDEERGKAIGLWSGFSALTAALGPLLGGWLVDNISWRWIFFINLPLALAVVAITLARMPESYDEEAEELDWWGAMLATLGLAGITVGLLESSNRGFDNPLVLTALLGGTAVLATFVVVETRIKAPMAPPALFRSSTFSGANVLTLFLYAALGGTLFFLPFNLIQVQRYSATAAGAAFLPTILLISLLSRWAGGLTPRYGARLPLTIGSLVTAVAYALLLFSGDSGSYWLNYFPALVVLGLGMAISVAPLTTAVMGAVPQHQAGVASGINNAVSRLASLFAVAGLGIVLVTTFNSSLDAKLDALSLSPEVRKSLAGERNNLAAIEAPAELNPTQTQQVERAIDDAFIDGFRRVMLISIGLALLSAAVAWSTIKT